jgi:hypothetical protein
VEPLTSESILAFLAAAASLAALAYADQLRKRLSLLHVVVILFALQNLLWGVIYLESGSLDPWDALLRLVMFSIRCVGLVALAAYATSAVNLRSGKVLAWLYAAVGLILVASTLIGYGDVEASVAGTMPVSEGLKSARRAFLAAGLGLVAVAMLAGLKSSNLNLRQRCRTTLRALQAVGLLYALHVAMRLLDIAAAIDAVLVAMIPLAISAVLWVLVLEEAQLLAPLRIKAGVLWGILKHRGTIDATTLNDCLERAMLLSALRRSENNKTEAARLLGLSKSTYHRKASRFLQQPAADTSLLNVQGSIEVDEIRGAAAPQ